MVPSSATPVLLAILAAATVQDLRTRRVTGWLTIGGLALALALAAVGGPAALRSRATGALVGGAILLPFVLAGKVGKADAYLLAAIGGCEGWEFALRAAMWTALAGAAIALAAWYRGKRTVPYVPAMLVGVLVVLLTRSWSPDY